MHNPSNSPWREFRKRIALKEHLWCSEGVVMANCDRQKSWWKMQRLPVPLYQLARMDCRKQNETASQIRFWIRAIQSTCGSSFVCLNLEDEAHKPALVWLSTVVIV
jgi:hypothetical protein